MPMRITCPHCGKQFSAWEELAGQTVRCPKCQQPTVIAGPNEALAAPPTGRSTAPQLPLKAPPTVPLKPTTNRSVPGGRPAEAAPGERRAGTPAPPPAKKAIPVPPSTLRSAGAPHSPTPPRAAPSAPPTVLPKPGSISTARTASPHDFDDDDSLPNGCPNCNATLPPHEDLCDACGYHLILKKVIDIRDMPKRNQATGMERLLHDQLHDPESASNTLLWAKIVGCVFALGVLWMCLGRWWWVGVLISAGMGGLYWMKRRARQAERQTGSSINDNPISQVAWMLLLVVQRAAGWRKLEWPFPRSRSLILRDPAFHDRELAGLDGLRDLEAMDLEGTGITDEALQHLRPLKQLRFLVVRRTQVTPIAARQLQQDLPQAMIWH